MPTPKPHLFPSLISSNLLHLATTISQLDPHCAGYHLDIMDNHFVPNLTWGPPFINAIAQETQRILWIHLMVDNPVSIIEQLKLPEKGPEQHIISVHLESPALTATLEKIKEKKWRASIALKPKTPISALIPFLDLVDHVLIMSVEPGFSGQQFLPETEQKIHQLITLLHEHKNQAKEITIALDGGIKQKNIAHLAKKGVTQFAIASAIFESEDPVKAVLELQKELSKI